MSAEAFWPVIEANAQDLGYELVDLELAQGGLLRVFIDFPSGDKLISISDCEALSNQLVHALPVEGIDFERLEVSSPGMDRRLSRHPHFLRFAGETVKARLRRPVNGQRNFEGLLEVIAEPLEGSPELQTYRISFAGKGGEPMALDFCLDEVDQVRLVPQFSFKEKGR
jgi:ribosome maturation factor RimP